MQREFTAVPSDWTVGQTIDYLRENKELPEEFLEIFIVDKNFKPVGTVPSSRVLRTSRDSKMNSIMREIPGNNWKFTKKNTFILYSRRSSYSYTNRWSFTRVFFNKRCKRRCY